MSGWEVGDLALCIRGGRAFSENPAKNPVGGVWPESGQIYYVRGTWSSYSVFADRRVLWLDLVDAPPNNGTTYWSAERFVKVTPPADMALESEGADVPAQVPA